MTALLHRIASFLAALWRHIVSSGPAAPVITSVTFDAPAYLPGAKITATVNYTAGTSDDAEQVTFTETDSKSGLSGTLAAALNVLEPDQMQSSASDPTGRKWALVSDNGSVAVLTATA